MALTQRHSDLTERDPGSRDDILHRLAVFAGVVIAATGMSAIVIGGLVAANTDASGLVGFAVILGGLVVMWAGLWIAGVDLI